MGEQKNYILDKKIATKKLERMAYEIAEQNVGEKRLILAGIKDNGVAMAHYLRKLLQSIFPGDIDVIELNLDKRNPGEIEISSTENFDDAVIIVVDDVANSGKTMLYALKPFLQYHPKKIQTLALVERTHKVYPVNTDYVGVSLATTLQEHIFVEVEGGEVTGAYLV
ncbi:phosphoribosyltransferase family protein [Pinibacter soli]|uniref:Phosphoribosyltransferase family protein n=1 Tax=Pinibacter soli TaxID=3044211 RepID=A0ABT6R9F5_9BACT|nr:phosphoribosyltransferase family protein [Pinibacter soli]MDI3319035.1 phosphoribosyltransferase family protein [Pinibacter soli]